MEQRPKGEEEPTAQGYGRETEAGSAVTGSPRRVQSRYMLSNPSKPVFFRNEEQDQVTKSFSNTASTRPFVRLSCLSTRRAANANVAPVICAAAPYTAGEAPTTKQLCADAIAWDGDGTQWWASGRYPTRSSPTFGRHC
jgi:hypothetical protein